MKSAIRVQYCLTLRGLSHKQLALLREGHDTRRDAFTLRVGDDDRHARLEGRDGGVRRAEVNSHHFLPRADDGCWACRAMRTFDAAREASPWPCQDDNGGGSQRQAANWHRAGAGSSLGAQTSASPNKPCRSANIALGGDDHEGG
mmetsp:Transcript_47970/g.133764  ORF Transcript_47970/g.133764 Transcript_47970/m.133764 type:complete len:145 (-) Transcript_47970:256-690(-)